MMSRFERKKLGEISKFSQGIQIPIEEQMSALDGEGVRFLRIVDYTQKGVEARYIKNPGKKYIVENNDIVMIRYGDAGRVVSGHQGAIANNLFKITPKDEILKEYLYQFLSSESTYSKLVQNRASTGLPAINFKTASDIEVTFPLDKQEQKKIKDILSSVGIAIEKTEAVIEQTEKVKKGLMQRLLTKGIGHTKFKKVEIGEIPEEWEIRKIADIGTFSNGVSKGAESFGSGYLFVNVREIASNKIELGKLNRVNLSEKELVTNEVLYGDILLIRSYGNPKKVGYPMLFNINNAQERFTHSGFTMKLRPHQHLVDSNFLVYLLKSDKIRGEVYKRGTFSANNNINQKEYGSIKIGLPPIKEQRRIAETLDVFNRKIFNEKERLTQLQVIKTGLMQFLLTGKVRVKVEESEVTQV